MQSFFKNIFLIFLLFSFCSCERIVDWGKDTFNQGIQLDKEARVPQKHIRSIFIYDQFTTKGNFVVMWLSNAVKRAYSDVYTRTNNYSPEKARKFLKEQLRTNEHYISFYILLDKNNLKNKILSDKNVPWAFMLKIGNKRYSPIETTLL